MPCRASIILYVLFCGTACFAQSPADSKIWGRQISRSRLRKSRSGKSTSPTGLKRLAASVIRYRCNRKPNAQRAVKAGVTISEMGFVDPFYAYYDSKLLKRRNPHVPLDRLEKEVAEYRGSGVRILAVYPPWLQREVYESHPEWRRIATNTTEIPQVDLKTVSARRHALPARALW